MYSFRYYEPLFTHPHSPQDLPLPDTCYLVTVLSKSQVLSLPLLLFHWGYYQSCLYLSPQNPSEHTTDYITKKHWEKFFSKSFFDETTLWKSQLNPRIITLHCDVFLRQFRNEPDGFCDQVLLLRTTISGYVCLQLFW